jgi:hypothetical protein
MLPGLAPDPGQTQGSSAIYGLIPCLLERHQASLESAEAASAIRSPHRQRYTWLWDERVPLAAVEALVQEGETISGWDRSSYLRDFGHFFFEQLVPRGQAGGSAAEEPLQPRFDVLLGPRSPHLPRGQEWPFPGPLAKLEDIQTQLRLCFRSMAGPRWEPAELDADGGGLTLIVQIARVGWGAMAIGMVEALAPRCGGRLESVEVGENQANLRLRIRNRELEP